MKNVSPIIAVAFAAAITVAGCSDQSLQKFQKGAGNLMTGLQTTQQVIAEVDDTVSQINATLYKNCKSIQTVGSAAVQVAPQCGKASQVIGGVNAAINSLCQAGPATGLASTAAAAANAYTDVKGQLAVIKKQCGS